VRYGLNLGIICVKLSFQSGKRRAGPDIQVLLYSGTIWFSVNLAIEWSKLVSPLHLAVEWSTLVSPLHLSTSF
jgi:hypothetical protein